MVSPHGGQLGVGFRHEGLQLFLEQLVRSLGRSGLHGGSGTLGTVVLGTVLETTLGALPTVAATEIILAGRCVFTLGLGLQTLDGQIDLAVFIADDHNLHILTFGQVRTDITDVGIALTSIFVHESLFTS